MNRLLAKFAGLSVAAIPLLVYVFYRGIIDVAFVGPLVLGLTSSTLLVYFRTRHEFRDGDLGRLLHAVLLVALASSVLWLVALLTRNVALPALEPAPDLPTIPESFLPEWWLLVFLVPTTLALVVAILRMDDLPTYESPSGIETLPQSPVYFGFATGFVGFWGVLFVGFGVVHRIVVVAPIFEELLKFGVALLFAAAIFGRSMLARYAVAVIAGIVFGTVEHVITYPGEPDVVQVFRVLFHAATAGLSISAYTVFEKRSENRLMWVSPVLAMLFHFAHNTFSVLSGIALYSAAAWFRDGVQLAFGFGVIIAILVVTAATLRRNQLVFDFHDWVSSFAPTHES